MAIIKYAKKRISVINKKTTVNRRVKNNLKAIVKNFDKAVAAGDVETAKEKLGLAEKKLMKAGAKGTIHKNAASRKVSRMTKAYNKAVKAAQAE
ncbi:MAG: 30S ribosomal protein S20 [Firmicutes bacterium]|nr:30S ribosomal protein S20 [Bacillota bacterium]